MEMYTYNVNRHRVYIYTKRVILVGKFSISCIYLSVFIHETNFLREFSSNDTINRGIDKIIKSTFEKDENFSNNLLIY